MLTWGLRLSTAVVAGALIGQIAGADAPVSRRDAESLRQKVTTITAFADHPVKQGRKTVVTENEVNAYLAYDAHDQLPKGVVDPVITIEGTGRLSGRATVDLDAVRMQHPPTSLFDPANLLMGRLPVTAVGVLTTKEGVGRFALESATLGGVPIPKVVLQEIVSYYSRSPDTPSGVGLDDPFPLPARIREIQVQRGQAIVVQ